jgi:hypothetical protein
MSVLVATSSAKIWRRALKPLHDHWRNRTRIWQAADWSLPEPMFLLPHACLGF